MTDTATPRASTGRLTVTEGDTIASTWGNTTFDQSVQQYDTAAARDTQWPTPKDGAVAYTVDTGSLWLRRAGAWLALPLGYVTQAVGPASQVDCGTAWADVTVVTFAASAGRRYRVTAGARGNKITAAGNGQFQMIDDASVIQDVIFANAVAAGGWVIGSAPMFYTPTTTHTATIKLQGMASTAALRCYVSSNYLTVEDIG